MKILLWLVGILLGILVLILVVTYGASELAGEVVTLERANDDTSSSQVRIWIVDTGENEEALIEHGSADSFWIEQLTTQPTLVLTRDGQTRAYQASPADALHDRYHKLRAAKYGWGDDMVALLTGGGECEGRPVRLQPIEKS